MRKLVEILKEIRIFPEVKVNHEKKYVEMRNTLVCLCGSNVTEAYWVLRRYYVKRVS